MIVFLFLSVYDADMTVSRYNVYVKMIFKFGLEFLFWIKQKRLEFKMHGSAILLLNMKSYYQCL